MIRFGCICISIFVFFSCSNLSSRRIYKESQGIIDTARQIRETYVHFTGREKIPRFTFIPLQPKNEYSDDLINNRGSKFLVRMDTIIGPKSIDQEFLNNWDFGKPFLFGETSITSSNSYAIAGYNYLNKIDIEPISYGIYAGSNFIGYQNDAEAYAEKNLGYLTLIHFGISSEVRELVFSNRFRAQNNMNLLNNFSQTLVRECLKDLKYMLKDDKSSAIKNLQINFHEKKENAEIWIETDGKEIYISPKLIRAMFIYSVSRFHYWFYMIYLSNANINSNSGAFRLTNIQRFNNLILSDFKQAFYFSILHEVAHIDLKKLYGGLKTELACDCEAIINLKKIDSKAELGLFKTLILESSKIDFEEIWGSKYNLEDRIDAINNFMKNPSNCRSLITSY